jgi:high-affinity nickel-transport protein
MTLGLALLAAFLLGLRHGSDHDHIAAIGDLATAEQQPRRAMKLGLLYALGHALTVLALGVAAIAFRVALPTSINRWSEQVVGLTLLVLGVYVLYTSVFGNGHAHPRSRFMLLADGYLYSVWRIKQMLGGDPGERRRLSLNGISPGTGVLVGVVHGIGAETPTQVMLFLLAANLGGVRNGLLGLAAFIVGLFTMNGVLCAIAAGLMKVSVGKRPRLQLVAGASAAYSILLGCFFLVGPWLH